MPNTRWPRLAAEYEDACARLTLIKPEIKPVLDVRSPDEQARRINLSGYRVPAGESNELHGIEQQARGLIDSYTSAKRSVEWQITRAPKRVKRTGAKL